MITLGGAYAQDMATQAELDAVAATIPPGWTQTAAKTANYTAADNEIVPLDTSGGTFTLTGPTSGKPFGFRWKAGATAPTIAAPSGYTISGAASVTPGLAPSTSSGELVLWQAFGTDYQSIGGFKPQSALTTANDARYGALTDLGMTAGHGVGNVRDLYRPAERSPSTLAAQSMISIFGSGHGWTLGSLGTAGTLTADTTNYVLGTQSAKLVTSGNGNTSASTRSALQKTITATDMTRKNVKLWVMIGTFASLANLRIIVGSDTSNYAAVDLLNSSFQAIPDQGAFYTLEIAPQASSFTVGTPNWSAITLLAVQAIDVGSGTQATVNVNGIATVPAAQDVYPNGVVSFSFDDGYADQFTGAKPILDAYGYGATAYVIQDVIGGSPGTYMSMGQLHALEDYSGWEVAAHAAYVADHNTSGGLTGISAQALDDDFARQKSWLINNGFRGVDHLAYPQGLYSDAVVATAKRYFAAARTINAVPTVESFPPADPMRMRCRQFNSGDTLATHQGAIDAAYNNAGWFQIYCHRVNASPSGTQTTPAIFKTVVDYVASKGMPVRAVGDVLRSGYAVLSANLVENARLSINRSGSVVGVRRALNLIPGTNVSITAADNASTESVDVTVAATGGGSGASLGTTEPALPGVATAGVATTAAPSDHVHPRTTALASDMGFKGWSSDILMGAIGNSAQGTGTPFVSQITLDTDTVVSNLILYLGVAAATPTTGQCFAGVYDSSGNQLAASADISSTLTSGATTFKTYAMTTPTGTLTAGTKIYGMVLTNATTQPQWGRASLPSALWTLSGTTRRFGIVSGTFTALPSSFTPSALGAPGAAFWMGVT